MYLNTIGVADALAHNNRRTIGNLYHYQYCDDFTFHV